MTRTVYVLALLVFVAAGGVIGQSGTPAKMVIAQKARAIPLSDVRLTGGPLKHAQDLNGAYLLALEPDRMMAFLRKSAGLDPKAEGYGGWDGPGRQLTGHIAGHHPFRRLRSERPLVAVVGPAQDLRGAQGRLPLHRQPHGLDVEITYAARAERILAGLDDTQIQQTLATEFGGMNEVMADLYADTGDTRWLALSDRFEHRAIIGPLARREDILAGKHGNTQVPRLLGSLVRYLYTGNEADGTAAAFFWDEVALHHSFATGGHGRNEYFGPPDKLDDMIEGRTGETCNVYNMITVSRRSRSPSMRRGPSPWLCGGPSGLATASASRSTARS